MILSRGRGYLFLHIPKTGGTALTLALEARAMKDDIIVGDSPKGRARAARQKGLLPQGRLHKHAVLSDLEGLLSGEEARHLFCVSLVRNPWDRLVSYYFWLREQRFAREEVSLAQRLDFADFVRDPHIRASFRAWPAARFFRDTQGQDCPAHYLRLEHLEQDLQPFEAHLGFRLWPLERANASTRQRDWRGYYSDETAAIVAADCAVDIARFGYGFDG